MCIRDRSNNHPVLSGWRVSTLPGRHYSDCHFHTRKCCHAVNLHNRHGRRGHIATSHELQQYHHHHLQNTRCADIALIGSSNQQCSMESMKTQKLLEQPVALQHSCPVIPMVRTYRGKGGLRLALSLAMGHCACYTTLHNTRHRSRSLGTIFENPCESRRVESLGSGNKEGGRAGLTCGT